jgi:hypothetical protein
MNAYTTPYIVLKHLHGNRTVTVIEALDKVNDTTCLIRLDPTRSGFHIGEVIAHYLTFDLGSGFENVFHGVISG